MLELELAIRFLRRRRGAVLTGTALAALCGVALATAALVITLALMNGYQGSIARALQRGNAHLVGFSPMPMSLNEGEAVARRWAESEGVNRARPVTYLAALATDPREPSRPLSVVVKAVGEPPSFTGLETWPETTAIPAVLGERLADGLVLEAGDSLTVSLPPEARSWLLPVLRLEVVGTFRLAFAEFDQRWVVVPLERVLAARPELGVAGVEVELDDPFAVERARDALGMAAPQLVITDWREMNRPLFAALRWQTLSLFLVLSLVVAVASFQVSSALVVLAIDKRRTTGMLLALGATPATVRRVLVLAGVILGSTGVVGGLAFGVGASVLMTELEVIRFPEGLARVYMVDTIPLVVAPLHLLAVAAVCGALVLAASWWPAWRSSQLDPVTALRSV